MITCEAGFYYNPDRFHQGAPWYYLRFIRLTVNQGAEYAIKHFVLSIRSASLIYDEKLSGTDHGPCYRPYQETAPRGP